MGISTEKLYSLELDGFEVEILLALLKHEIVFSEHSNETRLYLMSINEKLIEIHRQIYAQE